MTDDRAELTLDDLLAVTPEQMKAWIAARRLKLENPWVLDLVKVLYPHPRGLSRSIVLHTVIRARTARRHEVPRAVEETIQSAFQQHCVDSQVFKRRHAPSEDGIFHWPHGTRAGIWACYQEKARAWLIRRGIRA
jgi:hypothetical protein